MSNTPTVYTHDAFMQAVHSCDLAQVKALVDSMRDANGDAEGMLRVWQAELMLEVGVANKNDALIYYAMEKGASGGNGILAAAATGDMACIERIEEYRQITVYVEALARALRNGHLEVAKWAIKVNDPLDLSGALVAAAETDLKTLDWLAHNVTATPEAWVDAIEVACFTKYDGKFVKGALEYLQALDASSRAAM